MYGDSFFTIHGDANGRNYINIVFVPMYGDSFFTKPIKVGEQDGATY